ncbi:MAG TPA: hypothetical protein VER04_04020 [Polyangiaceae bacterium]|nr:hypothetical protein [Polyangiaceae bacterium]
MSAANPLPDSALQQAPESNADASEAPPTQPWNLPPLALDALAAFESEFDETDFDYHDTIPAPPWLDEPPTR